VVQQVEAQLEAFGELHGRRVAGGS
jgi:hypothetical protein